MYASAVVALIKNVFIDNLQDHSYTSSPRKWKRKLQEAESNLEAARKKIRNCQRRKQRAKQNCKFLVDDLYNKNMINMELRSKLDSYGGKLKG